MDLPIGVNPGGWESRPSEFGVGCPRTYVNV